MNLTKTNGDIEKDTRSMKQKTPVQVLHNYQQLAKFLRPEKREQLKQFLNISNDDQRRIGGLDNEDEFVVLIQALGWVKSCSGIEESSSKATGTETTDFFVETIAGRKIAIEVKSSKENQWLFQKKHVEKKIEYAKSHNHECYFALKLHGVWMLLSGEYVINHKCKISLEKDFHHSEMNQIFGDRLFMFPTGLEIITNYSKTKKSICGIQNTYGNAVRIAIKVDGIRKFLITTSNTNYVFLSIVLEAVENAMSNQEQLVKMVNDDKTIVIERLKENTFIFLSDLITANIKKTINKDLGECFSFQTYTEEMKKKRHKNLLDRKIVLLGLCMFENYPILMSLDNKNLYRLKDFDINKG